jgi:hypothetical protein
MSRSGQQQPGGRSSFVAEGLRGYTPVLLCTAGTTIMAGPAGVVDVTLQHRTITSPQKSSVSL